MTQTECRRRTVPGAELFFGESVAQYLADISDEAFYSGAEAEGLLLGKVCYDDIGSYCIVSGVSQDLSNTEHAVGWFRSSASGTGPGPEGIRRLISLFGYVKRYAIVIDYSVGTMAMFAVENGAARKVSSAMVENL